MGRALLGLVLNVQLSTASIHVAEAVRARGRTGGAGFGHGLGKDHTLVSKESR